MSDVTTVAFFGDAEHPFALTPWAIKELEEKTGADIGTLALGLPAGRFSFAELTETIRLALIGAGMAPKEAAHLVETYANPRPLGETFPLAVRILYRLWNGKDPDPEPVNDDVAAQAEHLVRDIEAAYADVPDV